MFPAFAATRHQGQKIPPAFDGFRTRERTISRFHVGAWKRGETPNADDQQAAAALRVSISVRAREHYETLRKARVGRLDTEYRNKMGWLAGNLHSRVDTTDWGEKDNGEKLEKQIIKELLDSPRDGRSPLWFPASWLQAADKKLKLKDVDAGRLEETIRANAPRPPVEIAVTEVKKFVDMLRTDFTDQPVVAFNQTLSTDSCILPLARPEAISAIHPILGHVANHQFWTFGEAISSDDYLRGLIVTALQNAASNFLKRQGPRRLDDFSKILQGMSLFPEEAAARVGRRAEEAFGSEYLNNKAATDEAISALKLPNTLVEHLRSVALASIQVSLPERLGTRLTNSPVFKATLRVT